MNPSGRLRDKGVAKADIDRNAPVWESAEIHISAPLETVWSVLTDFANWSKWNVSVTKMRLDGPVAPGTEFHWKGGGANIVSTIQELSPRTRILWTGRTFGIKAIHVWSFRPENDGVVVSTEESFAGVLPRILKSQMRRLLKKSLEEELSYLRRECEARKQSAASGQR
jgi:uncharacterized protein YndB with AHSA1/START domain